jgi:hypothetical protein
MNAKYRWIGTGLLSTSLAAVLMAQAPSLNVRMGLWEVSSTMKMSGEMPGMDTSKMTPEQKAQMAAAMQNMMARPTITKSCMTKEKFDQKSFLADIPGDQCKQVLKTNTASVLDATVTCTGQRPMTAQAHFESQSPTTFSGSMKSTTTEQGKSMNVDMTMAGKWISADCGDVK